ncbi:glycosyltransferase family 2 protein [Methylopila musalis]|uniref:Glycosyltransferase family 2 protein n=1 Tax=Methylopila musalis TaxID=1134781 RepID=A0ABW3Z7P6_9HYPH
MPDVSPAGEKVAIVAIVRNEARHVLEWVAHHRRLGAAEILIYDNESTDGTPALLEGLAEIGAIRAGTVLDADCVKHAPTIEAYRRGVAESRAEWVLFCDLDEFVHLEDGLSLDAFVARFDPSVGVVVLNRRAFGSSGQRAYVDAPVTERFRRGAAPRHDANFWVKSLARRSLHSRPGVHVAYTRGHYVHADGSPFAADVRPDGKESKSRSARIVHAPAALAYFGARSRAEFDDHTQRGNLGHKLAPGAKRPPLADAEARWALNDVNDEPIDWFTPSAPQLRAEIRTLRTALDARSAKAPRGRGLLGRLLARA